MSISINNQKDIIANSIRIVQQNGELKDIQEAINEAAATVEGNLSPGQIATISSLSTALDNDPNYFSNNQAALNLKADIGTTYTKTEVNNSLSTKANTADVFTKTEVNNSLALKANTATTYTKSETDTLISDLVGGAPGALNTLNELAAAINDDSAFSTTVLGQIATKAPIASPTFTGTVNGITKAMVGLNNVDNTSDLLKPLNTATQTLLNNSAVAWSSGLLEGTHHILKSGSDALGIQKSTGAPIAYFLENGSTAIYGNLFLSGDLVFSALGNATIATLLAAKAPLANPTFTGTVSGVTKSMVGLENVDNTSDANKPISTLTQAALDLKIGLDNTFQKTISGELTYLNINAAFRLAFDSSLNKVSIQYFDSDGTVVTDSWITLGEFNFNTDSNTASTILNKLTVNYDIICGDLTCNSIYGGAATQITNAINSAIVGKADVTYVVGQLLTKMDKAGGTFTGAVTCNNNVTITGNLDMTTVGTKLTVKEIQAAPSSNLELSGIVKINNSITGVTKAMVGLSNVDDTSDAAKPISSLTQTALNLKAPILSPTFTGLLTCADIKTSGDINFLPDRARIIWNDTNKWFSFQYYDNEVSPTNQWIGICDFQINQANKEGNVITNQVYADSASLTNALIDTITALNATSVTIDDSLIINESLTVNGTNVITALNTKQNTLSYYTPGGGSSIAVDTTSLKGFKGGNYITMSDASQTLTFHVDTAALAVDFQVKMNAVAPLLKTYNVVSGFYDLSIDSSLNLTMANIDATNNLTAQNTIISNSIQAYDASQVTINDNVVITGNLTVTNGVSSSSNYWCAGRVDTDGTKLNSKGLHTYTVSKGSPGQYTITMNAAHPDGANYICVVSGRTFHIPVFQDSSTVFRVQPKSAANANEDADFTFLVLR